MREPLIYDPTLRDGSHAINHQLTKEQIEKYCKLAETSGIPIVEIGHGNGLGASSLLVGKSLLSDKEMITTARKNLVNTKLGIHVIPGFATIKRDLDAALSYGVDVVRVASHCTEVDITERHIKFVADAGKEVYGVLMMSHMISTDRLLEEAKKMESYGASGIILMDSAGAYIMDDIKERVSCLVDNLNIDIGFHGHNNLGLGVANSITAVQSGASIIDATTCGFGAGAGNTQLEALIAVFNKMGWKTKIKFSELLNLTDYVYRELLNDIPFSDSISIVSGVAGVFSGFKAPVLRVAEEHNLNPHEIFYELGRRGVVAGQEDIIIEVAKTLSKTSKNI